MHSFIHSQQHARYPRLSAEGAYCDECVYTQADVASIVEHARMRGIRVQPEIDVPGKFSHRGGWNFEPRVCPRVPGLVSLACLPAPARVHHPRGVRVGVRVGAVGRRDRVGRRSEDIARLLPVSRPLRVAVRYARAGGVPGDGNVPRLRASPRHVYGAVNLMCK